MLNWRARRDRGRDYEGICVGSILSNQECSSLRLGAARAWELEGVNNVNVYLRYTVREESEQGKNVIVGCLRQIAHPSLPYALP